MFRTLLLFTGISLQCSLSCENGQAEIMNIRCFSAYDIPQYLLNVIQIILFKINNNSINCESHIYQIYYRNIFISAQLSFQCNYVQKYNSEYFLRARYSIKEYI